MYRHLARHKVSIAVVAIVAAASAVFFSSRQAPIYASEATVLIAASQRTDDASEPPVPPNLATEQRLASSTIVADRVIAELELDERPLRLLRDLHMEVVPGTEILVFNYEDLEPARAARIAQGFADAYLAFRQQHLAEATAAALSSLKGDIASLNSRILRLGEEATQTTSRPIRSELRARATLLQTLLAQRELEALRLRTEQDAGRIVDEAVVPTEPVRPNLRLNAFLGLFLGLMLGSGQAVLRGRVRRGIWSVDELEGIVEAPVLGVIPRVLRWSRGAVRPLISRPRTPRGVIEAFRALRESVLAVLAARSGTVLVVTSADPGEGKTVVAANLAIAMAMAGKRVVLVSADLRKAGLDELLLVSRRPGLGDVLTGKKTVAETLIRSGIERLTILPRGRLLHSPAELLETPAATRTLTELRGLADVVIIDTPPVSRVADALAVAVMCHGVILVVDQTRSDAASVRATVRQLTQLGVPLMGAVFNRADRLKAETRAWADLQESLSYAASDPAEQGNGRGHDPVGVEGER